MRTKFFILAVILGIATRYSSAITAKDALDIAYNQTVNGAVSLKFSLWRAANCDNEGSIVARCVPTAAPTACHICVCSLVTALPTTATAALPDNCDRTTSTATVLTPVMGTWNDLTTATPWTNISTAVPFQVYTVEDGYCFATNIDPMTGRTMKCFARRFAP